MNSQATCSSTHRLSKDCATSNQAWFNDSIQANYDHFLIMGDQGEWGQKY